MKSKIAAAATQVVVDLKHLLRELFLKLAVMILAFVGVALSIRNVVVKDSFSMNQRVH